MSHWASIILALAIGSLIGCAERSQPWPLGEQPGAPRPASSGPYDYCPKPGSAVGRRRSSDGAAIATLVYRRAEGGPPCVVAPNDGTAQFLDLLGMNAYQIDERPRLQPLGSAVAALFPLEVGKRASATVTGNTLGGGNFSYRFDFEVIGTETAAVPAGRIEAYVIRLSERGLPPNTFHVERAVWIDARSGLPIRVRQRAIAAHPSTTLLDWDATFLRQ